MSIYSIINSNFNLFKKIKEDTNDNGLQVIKICNHYKIKNYEDSILKFLNKQKFDSTLFIGPNNEYWNTHLANAILNSKYDFNLTYSTINDLVGFNKQHDVIIVYPASIIAHIGYYSTLSNYLKDDSLKLIIEIGN